LVAGIDFLQIDFLQNRFAATANVLAASIVSLQRQAATSVCNVGLQLGPWTLVNCEGR